MVRAIRTREMNVEYNKNKSPFSKIKLAGFAREFAEAFNA